MIARIALAAMAVLLALTMPAVAQTPLRAPTTRVDVGTLPAIQAEKPAPPFNADKAIAAYLGTVKGAAKANSDAYFEGGYYLLFVDAIYALAISAFLLWGRVSAWMRNRATKTMFMIAGAFAMLLKSAPDGVRNGTVKFFMAPAWQTAVYALQYIVVTTVLSFPLTVYEGFFREHAYGLSNQTFMEWFGEFGIGFALILAFGTLGIVALYGLIRRAGKFWWAWAAGLYVAFNFVGIVLSPVYIAPLFNSYKAMPPSTLQAQVLSLARANGIPATNVYVVDASRQSKRISANVSGLMGTTRISLNDNLLNMTTSRETLAVLGHEMGHYVLDHSVRLFMFVGIFALFGFGLADWTFRRVTKPYGARWNVMGIEDTAGFPVLFAIFVVFNLVTTPLQNTVSRTTEAQADIFGLNAARQPDGFASVSMKLSNYRKLDPSPLEEWVFYDHPSGRSRVTMAMRWKAEHVNDPDIKAGPPSPQ